MASLGPQDDQRPILWDEYVCSYETVFEPLTDQYAKAALDGLAISAGATFLDVAAGAGGAALMAARRGAIVTAIDASAGMVARISSRAVEAGLPVRAAVMDAHDLDLAANAFTDAVSIFGLILCIDPETALREIHRILVPGGRVAIVTWTDPGRYELITRLLAAIEAVCGARPAPSGLPAQLRFAEEGRFRALFEAAAFDVDRIERIEARLAAPSAVWLATHLDFAPGVAALLSGLGHDRAAVLQRFVADLVSDQGPGPVSLGAVAFLGLGRRH